MKNLVKDLHLKYTLGKFCQTFYKLKIPILYELYVKTEKQEKLSNSFQEFKIAMILKSIKSATNQDDLGSIKVRVEI